MKPVGAANATEEKPKDVKGVTPSIGLITRGKPHAVTKGMKKGSIELGTWIINAGRNIDNHGPWPTDPQSAVPYGLLHLCRAAARRGHTKKSGLAKDGGLKAPSLSDRCGPLVIYYIVGLRNGRSRRINDSSIWGLQMRVGDFAR